jgi:hypothetical protein
VTKSTADNRDILAIVLWAGSNLSEKQITPLKQLYETARFSNFDNDTDLLAEKLFANVTMSDDPMVDNVLKSCGKSGVHQALDQEVIHANVTADVSGVLFGEVEVAEVKIFRPSDRLFLRPKRVAFESHWNSYTDLSEVGAALAAEPLGSRRKILITIGHGFNSGETHFPSMGMLNQKAISSVLTVAADNDTLYVPLQCYPSAAVRAWFALRGRSASIVSADKSSDTEMRNWVTNRLGPTARSWQKDPESIVPPK